jgi:protein-disulfide isomerase
VTPVSSPSRSPAGRLVVATALALGAPAAPGCAPAAAPPPPAVAIGVAPPPSPPAATSAAVAAPDAVHLAVNPLPISKDDASRGPEDALVTVVLFADIRSSWSTLLLDLFETDYLRQFPENTVRFVWKHSAFDWDEPAVRDEARRLAVAAAAVRIAAGSEAFFKFMSLARERDPLTKTGREELAIAAGASPARFDAALQAGRQRVAADQAILRGLPFPGPYFYVNGASGNVRFSCNTAATIARELQLAREALAAGTPRDQVVAERVRANVASSEHCVLNVY